MQEGSLQLKGSSRDGIGGKPLAANISCNRGMAVSVSDKASGGVHVSIHYNLASRAIALGNNLLGSWIMSLKMSQCWFSNQSS